MHGKTKHKMSYRTERRAFWLAGSKNPWLPEILSALLAFKERSGPTPHNRVYVQLSISANRCRTSKQDGEAGQHGKNSTL